MAGTSSATNVDVRANLEKVRENIARATARAGRTADSVRLLAVSKTKPIELIREAMRAGQAAFGENYVQEALGKSSALPDAEWHLIGSLQTNKTKLVVGRFALIHSVDRSKLVDALAKAAESAGCRQDVLLQIRIGEEETKQGVDLGLAPPLVEQILQSPTLRLRGLMSLPPLAPDESVARARFAALREALFDWRKKYGAPDLTELSIGTSSDYEWAIMEGATLVRVGTAIFGERE